MLSFNLEIDAFDSFPDLVATITYTTSKDFDFAPCGEEFAKNSYVNIEIKEIVFTQFGCELELPTKLDIIAHGICEEAAEEHYLYKGCAA